MIKDLIALDNSSKVWIYPASREISYDELDEMRPMIFNFLDQWTAHNQSLITYGNIFHRRFLGIFVDETVAGASGCSIDASVHFIKDLGSKYGIDFFDRQKVQFMIDDEVKDFSLSDLKHSAEENELTEESLFIDNLVKDKDSFLNKWIIPVQDTWAYRFMK